MFFPSFDSLNILTSFILSFVLQAVLFGFAVLFVTDKVTDLAYSLAFIVLCLIFFFTGGEPLGPRLLLTLLVVFWGLRLGSYLFIRILKTGRDARFDGIREHPWKFAAFWAMQALTVWIVMLPITAFLSKDGVPQWSPLSWIGALDRSWIVALFTASQFLRRKFVLVGGVPGNRCGLEWHPLVDRSRPGNNPEYLKYKRTTHLFVPLPPRKDSLEH